MATPDIRNALMLVSISMGLPRLRRLDKRATQEVIASQNAQSDAGRFNKLLLPETVARKLVKVVNDARSRHYVLTLPWTDEGWRALPVKAFEAYAKDIAAYHAHFDEVAQETIDNYEEMRHNDKARLGDMFNADDYPPVAEFASRFAFEVKYRPVPDAADFRVDLQADVVETIRGDIMVQMQSAQDIALKDCFERAAKAVGHMADTLMKPPGNRFHDTLVDNVSELVELLPMLNFSGDQRIDDVVEVMRNQLTANKPDALREDIGVRMATAAAANKLTKTLKGWL